MNTYALTSRLRTNLPESLQPWVLPALRQETLLWDTLHNEAFYTRALAASELRSRFEPEAFAPQNKPQFAQEHLTPAALALRGLQLKWTPEMLRAEPLPPLEAELSQAARRARDSLARRPTCSRDAGENAILPTLPQAVLAALALRERRRVTGGWQGIADELYPALDWHTPVAILYDLTPDPQALIDILTRSPAHTALALHALLSQPLPPEEQLAVLTHLSAPDWQLVLHLLEQMRPNLARQLARWRIQTLRIDPAAEPLKNLTQAYQFADDLLLAGDPQRAMALLQQTLKQAHQFQAELLGRSATQFSDPNQARRAWQEAIRLDPENPRYRAELAINYLDTDQIPSAVETLCGDQANSSEDSIPGEQPVTNGHPAWLYAQARACARTGDLARARQLCLQSLSALESPAVTSLNTRAKAPASAPASRTPIQQVAIETLSGAQKLTWLKRQARLLFELGLNDEANIAVQKALAGQPADAELLSLGGDIYMAVGDPIQAATCYRQAVMVATERTDWRRSLAASLETAGEWTAALDERTGITISATNPNPVPDDWHALAACALHETNSEQAISACQQALTRNADDGIAHALYGEALAQIERRAGQKVGAEALAHYRQATVSAPNLSGPWLALAAAMQDEDKPEKTIEILRTAAQAAPEAIEIHRALGEAYLNAQAPTQALSAFQRALEIDANAVEIIVLLGQTLCQLGHLSQAREKLDPAYHQHPDNLSLAQCYGRVLLETGEPERAIPALRQVVASKPEDAAPYMALARALLMTNPEGHQAATAAEVIYAVNQALQFDPHNAEAQALLAEALALAGKHAEAIEAYHKAMETPRFAANRGDNLVQEAGWRARLALGLSRSALALEQTETAIAALQEALQAEPVNLPAYRLLTSAYQIAGLDKNAFLTAQAALQIDPDDVALLLWYAETMLHIVRAKAPATGAEGLRQELTLQHQSEALGALNRAHQLAPQRADVLLRLGQVQLRAGDENGALKSLRGAVTADEASAEDLHQAACLLVEPLDELCTAITGLERAVRLSQTSDARANAPANAPAHTASLLVDLAEIYRRGGDSHAAGDILEQALLLFPDEIELSILKIDWLLEAAQYDRALTSLEMAFERWPEAAIFHYQAALAWRGHGLLVKALMHAEKSLGENALSPYDNPGQAVLLADIRLARRRFSPEVKPPSLLAAEIAQGMLESGRARSYLTNMALRSSCQADCLRAELALEADEEIEAAEALTAALEQSRPDDTPATQARLLALQARLAARRGDWEMAISTFDEACAHVRQSDPRPGAGSAEARQSDELPTDALYPHPALQPQEALSLASAALELTQWATALAWIAQAEAPTASEGATGASACKLPPLPLTPFSQARALVLRAEFQRECQLAQVIGHAPGDAALDENAQVEFEQALEKTRQRIAETGGCTLGSLRTAHSGLIEESWALSSAQYAALSWWQQRGQSAFEVSHASSIGSLQTALPDLTASTSDWRKPRAAMAYARLAFQAEQTHTLLEAQAGMTGLQAIRIALGFWPDEPRWQALAGRLQMSQGDLAAATAHLEQAVRLEPKNISHLLCLGQGYLQDETQPGRFKRALRLFERASRLSPELAQPWLALARTYLLTGDGQQAKICAERAAELNPQLPAARLLQAEIALKTGDPQAAIEHARAASELQPAETDGSLRTAAALLMAHALEELKRPQEAIASLEQALKVVSDPLALQLEHIRLLSQSSGAKAALPAALGLAQQHPTEATVLAALAETQARAGEDQAAITTARHALHLIEQSSENEAAMPLRSAKGSASDTSAALHQLIGEMMSRSGQLDQAVHHLSEAVQLKPERVEAYLILGGVLQERRQYRQALQTYQQAASVAPHDYRPFYQAGIALKEAKDYEESEAMLRAAASLAPGDVSIRRQLAAVAALNLVHNRRRTSLNPPILPDEGRVAATLGAEGGSRFDDLGAAGRP